MEIIDFKIKIKIICEIIFDLSLNNCKRILDFLECYQRLVLAKSYTEVTKVKEQYDRDVCIAVHGYLPEAEQQRIKQLKENG